MDPRITPLNGAGNNRLDDSCNGPRTDQSAEKSRPSSTHAIPARHYLRNWAHPAHPAAGDGSLSGQPAGAEPARGPSALPPGLRCLVAGQAMTLRARRPSVLRISHGRVWLTLTRAGPYRRVLAGDHFLTRGERLTLLPGQELVMEPFGTVEGAPVQFTWGELGAEGVAARAPRVSAAAHWRGSVVEPLLDLRHAIGLAARATGVRVLRGYYFRSCYRR